MEVVILLVIGVGAGVAGTLARTEEQRGKTAAVEVELEALRSAQALSVRAWEAEQAMFDLAQEYEQGGGRG